MVDSEYQLFIISNNPLWIWVWWFTSHSWIPFWNEWLLCSFISHIVFWGTLFWPGLNSSGTNGVLNAIPNLNLIFRTDNFQLGTRWKANKWAIRIVYTHWIEMAFETPFVPHRLPWKLCCPRVNHGLKCNQWSFGSIWTSEKGIHFKWKRDWIMMFSTLTWHELWFKSG